LAIRPARLLFSAIVAAELVHTGIALLQRRLPVAHDGFQYFTLQYYFLNNALQSREVAQWVPYLTHGSVATLWYGIQSSFLQSVLIHTHVVPSSVNLVAVYYLNMLVDEMVLLVGTWLLATRFFRLPAVFFISATVVGSAVYLDQPYWNFRLFFALPLVIELGHRFLERARWSWFFLAANLLAAQMMGNLPYLIPVQSLAVAVYFAAYALLSPSLVWRLLRALTWNWRAVAAVGGGVVSFALVYASFTIGTRDLVAYSPFRHADGSTDLSVFLTYGGLTDLRKWTDLALNISPWLDLTLYAGILLLPLALLGAIVAERRQFHFVVVTVVMLLFTLGTWVSTMAFHVWPGMNYFRHIGLISSLVKVMLCFVGGIGFQWLCDWRADAGDRALRQRVVAGLLAAALLAGISVFAYGLSRHHAAIGPYTDALSDPGVDRPIHTYNANLVARRLQTAASLAAAGAVLLGVFPFVRKRRVGLCVALVFVAADVYYFKITQLIERTDRVPAGLSAVVRTAPMPYARRRDRDLRDAALDSSNPRLNAALAFSPMMRQTVQGRVSRGAQYWTNNMFLFADEPGSTFRVDSWLAPFDELLRTYWHVPIDDHSTLPAGTAQTSLVYPLKSPASGRIAGITEDKIRFFTDAYAVGSLNEAAAVLADPSFAGNLLLVLDRSSNDESNGAKPPVVWSNQRPLSEDDTLPLSYRVDAFDANSIQVTVTSPAPAWMAYADVWHPDWRVTVNGRTATLYRANLAYKAVALASGENVVRMRFGSPLFSIVAFMTFVNAAFWIVATSKFAATI
jgi:hypothetical protein